MFPAVQEVGTPLRLVLYFGMPLIAQEYEKTMDSTAMDSNGVKKASTWRLVNLSLGFSAIIFFLDLIGGISFKPLTWLSENHYLLNSYLVDLPPFLILAIRIFLNFILPSSLFLILFLVLGVHKKCKKKLTIPGCFITIIWMSVPIVILYIVKFEAHSQKTVIFFVISLSYISWVIKVLVFTVTVFSVIELVSIFRSKVFASNYVQNSIVVCMLLPPIITLILLLPTIIKSQQANQQFKRWCEGVGVQLLDEPSAPVKSVAYDWDLSRPRIWSRFNHITIGDPPKVISYRYSTSWNQSKHYEKVRLDFIERRRHIFYSGRATINPDAAYYHYPRVDGPKPYYGVESLSADVLAFLNAKSSAGKHWGALHTLTVTDRRSGTLLGIQTYVVDRINNRACGANIGNVISQQEFIFSAISR